jgi:hypothetical protein
MDLVMPNGVTTETPAPDSGAVPDVNFATDVGFDQLPASLRRSQRFGGVAAARLAEALALRREIDAVAGRLASWVAGAGASESIDAAVLQATWVHLRRAGIALRAEIDAAEIDAGPRAAITAASLRGRLTDPEQAA